MNEERKDGTPADETTGVRRGRPRGFALLTPERRIEISRMGGKAVLPEHRMFSRSKEFARKCGSIGGKAVKPCNRTFSSDRNAASVAGKKGVQVRRSHRVIQDE